MKKLAIISCTLLLSACGSLLDVEPSNSLSGDVFKDQAGIQSALTGAYFNLGGINDGVDGGELFGGDFMLIPSLLVVENEFEMNWDAINGFNYNDFVNKDIQAVNARVEANWRRAYEVFNVLNSILVNIDNVGDATAKARIEGEAKAMRAILYFEMVRLWGPDVEDGVNDDVEVLPLLLLPVDEPGASPPLNTMEEIYDQIDLDLNEASTLLQPFGTNGTAISYYTCQAYMMRIAMHRNDFATAITHANTIINDGQYMLANDPKSAFNNTSNSTEDIFAIQQTPSNNSGALNSGSGATNFYSSLSNQGLGAMRIIPAFLNNIVGFFDHSPEYDSLDLRWGIDSLDATSTVADIESGFYVNVLNTITLSSSKYASSDRVIPVIRYSEVLLTRAEARVQENQNIDAVALADYNEVRMRSGLPELQAGDFLIWPDLYDSILVERRREFLYEGHLYHDLKRLNGVIGPDSLKLDKFLLPIPQSELDAGLGN